MICKLYTFINSINNHSKEKENRIKNKTGRNKTKHVVNENKMKSKE